jgi:hypothetical protein
MNQAPNLSAIVPPVLDAEVLPPTVRDIRVMARPNPLSAERTELHFQPGTTVAELVEGVQSNPVLRKCCRVYLGDEKIPPENWRLVRPKSGTELTIVAVPMGGGNAKILRFVLFAAVAALSIAAPYLAPVGSALAAGTLGGSLLSVGVGVVGQLHINARPPR